MMNKEMKVLKLAFKPLPCPLFCYVFAETQGQNLEDAVAKEVKLILPKLNYVSLRKNGSFP